MTENFSNKDIKPYILEAWRPSSKISQSYSSLKERNIKQLRIFMQNKTETKNLKGSQR